ncbi:hypothetical protein FQY83_11915 [Luteimonas marina]|uniref:Uncharacterized protein n=1 Tax=Luteimonas marina TaxID=488485 RepID=A0A5C5TXX5_9GAMM|nr:hypothetical protein [Luteimonas marina]TWT19071.1 hypothetical protein FQY83_11915 [Luteimonas marina]
MTRTVVATLMGLLVTATGCVATSNGTAIVPERAIADFNGSWSVEWCDRADPDLDCGGFSVTLVQDGSHICGGFGGALVNLRQVDEGDVVGRVDGDTAILEVRSGRNDAIVRVRARRVGGDLHWEQDGTVRRGGPDIDVIAFDDVLKPATVDRRRVPKACDAPSS